MADLISSLPDEVLKLIMEHVPLDDRLTSFCLVNRRLHAAAVAFEELALGDWRNTAKIPDFQDCVWSWLRPYGHHLTRLRLNFGKPLQRLPCPNLLDLQLSSCAVPLGTPAAGQQGVFQGCTKLTRLLLQQCNIITTRSDGVVDGLSSLVHLQRLEVWPATQYPAYPIAGLSRATLPSLTQLTYLSVKSLSRGNLAQLGVLTDLQEIHLHADADYPDLAHGPSSVPGLAFPASLSKLVLRSSMEPALLSLVPAGLKVLKVLSEVQGPVEGPGSLLSHVALLQNLTELALYPKALPSAAPARSASALTASSSLASLLWPEDFPPEPLPSAGPAYSALTASSTLALLLVPQDCMPEGVWPHVFPASRTLLHFTCLHFVAGDPECVPSPWAASDVSRLVNCCPNLRRVKDMTLLHGSHVSELHKLTCLTSLAVSFVPSDLPAAEESLKGLAAVTQLRELDITMEQYLTIAATFPLTQLTSLTQLGVDHNKEDGWCTAEKLELRQVFITNCFTLLIFFIIN